MDSENSLRYFYCRQWEIMQDEVKKILWKKLISSNIL